MYLRRSIRLLFALVCLAALGSAAARAQAVRTAHATIELVTQNSAVSPGQDFLAGLHFQLDPGWHIYWINAGDAGEPPRITWQLSDGITAGDLQFPAPQRLPLGPLMDFGYEHEVLLPVPMHAATSLHPGTQLLLQGHLSFLICSQVCIPAKADLRHAIPVSTQAATPSAAAPLFVATLKQLPVSLPATASVSVAQLKTALIVTLHTGARIASAEIYPFDPNLIANAAPQQVEPLSTGARITLLKAPGPSTGPPPSHFHALIKFPGGAAYTFRAPITAAAPTSSPANAPLGRSRKIPAELGLAFLGGLILNLMPCVFPVLFLKGLALVQSSGQERQHLRLHGLVYTLGILVSFWIIVALLLLLRAGGHHLGWGFQFQSPIFVAVMAILFFFLGLSLAGLFDIGLSATSAGGTLAARSGYTGSFFTGVLATVVATPCTAPFMGAAIGFALSQSAAVTFAVFTLLALGLAAPYVLLTLQPAWIRLLPCPGAWMEYLKQAISLPIFASVIWMAWVFAQITGSDGVARLLAGLLLAAIAGWALGRWPVRKASTAAAILLLAAAVALPGLAARNAAPASSVATQSTTWQPFSPARIVEARAHGRLVFVDFSAAWCLSCQVNERAVLDRPDTLAAFRRKNVLLLRADWTNHDDSITDALRQLGRSGVPTYALYSGNADAAPTLLPEVLTRSIVLDALAKLN